MTPPAPARTALALLAVLPAALGAPAPAAPAEPNALAGHPSPYLAMHGDDPVRWRPWGREALAAARDEDRLLFVSVGYFSCHWCHVMHRESYRDAAIAGRLNAGFVPVKVDRELHPALDAHLIDFVQRTRGHAGWPLNVFLTPEGHPLVGVTYLPPEAFAALLDRLAARWDSDRDGLRRLAAAGADALAEARPAPSSEPITAADGRRYRDAFVAAALDLADELAGGFGDTNKFPMAPQLDALLAIHAHAPAPRLGAFLRLTLGAMAGQGLRDHLGGGFFRYATDPAWQVPHFEKMLYDNALLAALYLRAAVVLDVPGFERIGRETLDFMLRALAAGDGAFVSSLSAVDAAGVEGGVYLWQASDLAALLDEAEHAAARLAWGFDGPPALEHGHLPVARRTPDEVAARLGVTPEQVRERLAAAAYKLRAARAQRSPPRDHKRLAAWNGLALSALAAGARLDGGEAYRRAGARLRDFLAAGLWDGRALRRAGGDAAGSGAASLEDYAYVARGLLDWWAVSGDGADRALARTVAEGAWSRFHDAGGWRLGADLLIPAAPAEAVLADGPMPSPSAVLVETSLRLAGADDALRAEALAALARDTDALARAPFFFATQIRVLAAYADVLPGRPGPGPAAGAR